MTNGGRHSRLRTRIPASNAASAQYQGEVTGGGAPTGKANSPPGRSDRRTPANRPGRSAGRKCPNAPKLTARSNPAAKGIARTSACTQCVRRTDDADDADDEDDADEVDDADDAHGAAPLRAAAIIPALKSTPVTLVRQSGPSTRRPAPVPQQTSSPSPNGPSGTSAAATASSTRSGVRNGVWSNFGASRSYPCSTDDSAWTASSRSEGPSGEN